MGLVHAMQSNGPLHQVEDNVTELQRMCRELLHLWHIVYECFLPAVLEMKLSISSVIQLSSKYSIFLKCFT
jgi:hypothetical protein